MTQRNIANNHSVDYQTTSGKQQWTHSARYNSAYNPPAFQWTYKDQAEANPDSDSYEVAGGKEIGFHTTGYYLLTVGTTPIPATVYVWGAGGGGSGPSASGQGGGAGGGVKADITLTAQSNYTAIVGGGVTFAWDLGGFPDGGTARWNNPWPGGAPMGGGPSTKYGGGGRSSFGEGTIPFANKDSPTTEYLLIGGGGGGATNHMDAGTAAAYGGYPSGADGGLSLIHI